MLDGLQGLMVAFAFCYRNGEVKKEQFENMNKIEIIRKLPFSRFKIYSRQVGKGSWKDIIQKVQNFKHNNNNFVWYRLRQC